MGQRFERRTFAAVPRSIGFDLTEIAWRQLAEGLVQGAILLEAKTRRPVATAVLERREGGWLELGWVAVHGTHRGRRLGDAVCRRVLREALAAGEERLFGSTQDQRLAALRNSRPNTRDLPVVDQALEPRRRWPRRHRRLVSAMTG